MSHVQPVAPNNTGTAPPTEMFVTDVVWHETSRRSSAFESSPSPNDTSDRDDLNLLKPHPTSETDPQGIERTGKLSSCRAGSEFTAKETSCRASDIDENMNGVDNCPGR
jgi:hypothetical protein